MTPMVMKGIPKILMWGRFCSLFLVLFPDFTRQLPPHLAHIIDFDGGAVAVVYDQNGKANGGFSCRDGEDKERKNLSAQVF